MNTTLAIEESCPSRFILVCPPKSPFAPTFIWSTPLPDTVYVAIGGAFIHIKALTPSIRVLHASCGLASDVQNDFGEFVVNFEDIVGQIPHIEIFTLNSVDNVDYVSGESIVNLPRLRVVDIDVVSFGDGLDLFDLSGLEYLRAMHLESDTFNGKILLPKSIESFADLRPDTCIRDDTFCDGVKVHALALNSQWVDHARTATWWTRVWTTVRVGLVILEDRLTIATADEEDQCVVSSSLVSRRLPKGPGMELFVFAPCEVNLRDAINELDVFSDRAHTIRVIREFDYSATVNDHVAEGTFENDVAMLKEIRRVCPRSRVCMYTDRVVNQYDIWNCVRASMRPPSVSVPHWCHISKTNSL